MIRKIQITLTMTIRMTKTMNRTSLRKILCRLSPQRKRAMPGTKSRAPKMKKTS